MTEKIKIKKSVDVDREFINEVLKAEGKSKIENNKQMYI